MGWWFCTGEDLRGETAKQDVYVPMRYRLWIEVEIWWNMKIDMIEILSFFLYIYIYIYLYQYLLYMYIYFIFYSYIVNILIFSYLFTINVLFSSIAIDHALWFSSSPKPWPGCSERDLPVTTSASCRRCFRNIFDLQQCGLWVRSPAKIAKVPIFLLLHEKRNCQ